LSCAGSKPKLRSAKDQPAGNNFRAETVYLLQVTYDTDRTCAIAKVFPGKKFLPDKSEKDTTNERQNDLVLRFYDGGIADDGSAGSREGSRSQSPASDNSEVKIDNFSFGPATLTVAPGTTVTWVNHDDIPHTVVSTDSVFKSKVLDTDEKFSFTFTKAGTYPYFCSIHRK